MASNVGPNYSVEHYVRYERSHGFVDLYPVLRMCGCQHLVRQSSLEWICNFPGQGVLWIFRSSKSAQAPPMVLVYDRDADHFSYSTRFRSKVRRRADTSVLGF